MAIGFARADTLTARGDPGLVCEEDGIAPAWASEIDGNAFVASARCRHSPRDRV